jgi:hypothetical protein
MKGEGDGASWLTENGDASTQDNRCLLQESYEVHISELLAYIYSFNNRDFHAVFVHLNPRTT